MIDHPGEKAVSEALGIDCHQPVFENVERVESFVIQEQW